MKIIPLSGNVAAGRVALVDDEDYALVSQYRWHVYEKQRPGRNSGPYVQASIKRDDGRHTTIRMHCLIIGRSGIDHRNGNGLDNQRANLRSATSPQNAANQFQKAGTYKGVSWKSRLDKWQAHIRIDGHLQYLGVYAVEEDAARAYDATALAAWGEFARLNFPGLTAR